MCRHRIGVFVLCAAAFALASCGSDASTGPRNDTPYTLLGGSWSSTTVSSPPRAYGVFFFDSTTSNGWIMYGGEWPVQNGISFATGRKYIGGPTVEMTFGADEFHGKFVSTDTIVGAMNIESVAYPITFARGF